MTANTILEKIHRKFAKDTDYPEAGSEDFLVRLDYVNDAITEWENKAKEGIYWEELKDQSTVSCGGTGTDALPTDFLSFIRKNNADDDFSALVIGNEYWLEVTMAQGIRAAQEGIAPHIFWREGTNLRSLPAMSGSLALPYIRKATRYETGAETDEPEMKDQTFIEDFVLSKVFLDNDDQSLYQAYALSAKEKLDGMMYDTVAAISE